LERLDAAPDHDRLKKISRSTGGKYISPADDLQKTIGDLAQKAEKQFVEEKLLPLWATPYVLVIVLSLLTTEWYFRRRWGLI
jgi:hypothetical protein